MNRPVEELELRFEHLLLLRRLYIVHRAARERGAPWIDPKRPLGNSDLFGDMARILGRGLGEDAHGEVFVTKDAGDDFRRLWGEMPTVLEIALATGRFELGRYERGPFGWEPSDMPWDGEGEVVSEGDVAAAIEQEGVVPDDTDGGAWLVPFAQAVVDRVLRRLEREARTAKEGGDS